MLLVKSLAAITSSSHYSEIYYYFILKIINKIIIDTKHIIFKIF